MYLIQLYLDTFALGSTNDASLLSQHNILFVKEGRIRVNEQYIDRESTTYVEDFATIATSETNAVIYRWAITRDDRPVVLLSGRGITSTLLKSREIRMFDLVPTSEWLFKLDCVYGLTGSTGLHAHPGSGIRICLKGRVAVDSQKGETYRDIKEGETWYEEGSYAVNTTFGQGLESAFLRAMIMSPEYIDHQDTLIKLGKSENFKFSYKAYDTRLITLR